MRSGAVTIRSATDHEIADLVNVLAEELESFAFERERVLEKLDIRAAQRARRTAREVRVVLRALPVNTDDVGREAVLQTLGQLLGEAHDVLEGVAPTTPADALAQSGSRPIEDIADEARRIAHSRPTRSDLDALPSLASSDDEGDEDAGMNETIARRVAWERSGNRVLGR